MCAKHDLWLVSKWWVQELKCSKHCLLEKKIIKKQLWLNLIVWNSSNTTKRHVLKGHMGVAPSNFCNVTTWFSLRNWHDAQSGVKRQSSKSLFCRVAHWQSKQNINLTGICYRIAMKKLQELCTARKTWCLPQPIPCVHSNQILILQCERNISLDPT